MISVDDVVTGLLVNAISAAGRWLGTAASAARSGRGQAEEELAVVQWFETYKLTERVPALPGLSDKSCTAARGHSPTAVTQRELVAAATEFLHGRGFEQLDHAREAAREFIEFSRGRMWVSTP
jgi:hypothetical protein